ncbi:hypothetical protein QFC21_001432 [Naganishia friedmannii]|uniref:Uncharacterized protein n=1 Tax=Naganishia friedmannii TaxID=89922 RepID=A0ACC2W5D2_9TREE|nr:hypothetical protein QFC21_001432 [Naganishia friedmannii]
MNIELEDQSVLLRKIEQHRLREQNLSSLPSLDQTSDYEGSDEEENREYFEELKRKNRAARETEDLEKENIARDFDGEDTETPVPTRVSKKPIFSQAQKVQRSTTPPYQPVNRVLQVIRSPAASTVSSEPIGNAPNDSGASSNGLPVTSTPAPNRPATRSTDDAPPASDGRQKQFAKSIHQRDQFKRGRYSSESSANGSFSIATIQHQENENEAIDSRNYDLYSNNNSLDLPKLTDRDLPAGVQYHDYAVPIKGGEDSNDERDEPTTARKIVNRNSYVPNNAADIDNSSRVEDDRFETSLEDQANFDYTNSERGGDGSERGQDMSDFTDADEAKKENVVDIIVDMPDETVDSNGSPAPDWVNSRVRYRSQSPGQHRPMLPRSPHPRALLASVNSQRNQERIPSLSRTESENSDQSGSLDNIAQTPMMEDNDGLFSHGVTSPGRLETGKQTSENGITSQSDSSNLDDIPEANEYSDHYDASATPARMAQHQLAYTPTPMYSHNHSTLSTPGIGRNASVMETPLQQTQPPSFDTMIRERSLRDITSQTQHENYNSPAPSEYALSTTKGLSMQTPKPIDRSRANFLLSALNSTSKPMRRQAIAGRMSLGRHGGLGETDAVELSLLNGSVAHRQGHFDDEAFSIADISSVSISSSVDLTTDRRLSTARPRGNMSVPDIILPDGPNQDGVNHGNLIKQMRLGNIALSEENKSQEWMIQKLTELCASHRVEVPQDLQFSGQKIDHNPNSTTESSDDAKNAKAAHELDLQVQQLSQDCQQKDEEISRLNEILKASTNKLSNSVPGNTSDTEDRIEQLQQEHKKEMQQLAQDLEHMKGQAQSDKSRIQELQQELDDQDDIAAKDKADFETDFRELEDRITALTQEKERLVHAMDHQNLDDNQSRLQDELEHLREELKQSTEQLEGYEQHIRDLQAKLEHANDENAQFVGDAFQAEDTAKNASFTRRNVEADLEQQDLTNKELQSQLERMALVVSELKEDIGNRDEALDRVTRELATSSKRIEQLQDEKGGIQSELQTLKPQVIKMRASLDTTTQELQRTEEKYVGENCHASNLQRRLDSTTSALEAAQGEIQILRTEVESQTVTSTDNNTNHQASEELVKAENMVKHLQGRLAACEDELERAHHQSANQARQMAAIRQKDIKIDTLTTEKAALSEHIRMLSNQTMAMDMNTPVKGNAGNVPPSPFGSLRPINRVLLNLRTPRTPGQLSEMTWLSASSAGGAAEEAVLAQLQTMGEELKEANKHIEENFSELEKRGMLGCSLADELADAYGKIASLKERLQHMHKQHNGVIDQLVATVCPGCDLRFDAAEPLRSIEGDIGNLSDDLAASSSNPERSRLRQSLAALREQYEGLQHEFKKHRERQESQVDSLNEDIDALVNEKMKMIEENRKTFCDLENEHIKQSRQLRNEKEEIEHQKHLAEVRLTQAQKELESNRLKASALQRESDATNMRIHSLKTEGSELRTQNNKLTAEMEEHRQRIRAVEVTNKDLRRLKSELGLLQTQYSTSKKDTASAEQECNHLREQLCEMQDRLVVADEKSAKEAKSHDRLHKQLTSLEMSLKEHRREAVEFSHGLKSMQKQHALDKHKAAMAELFEKEREQAMSTIANLEARLAEMQTRQSAITSTDYQRGIQVTDNGHLQREHAQLISDRRVLTGQVRYLQSLYARENTFRDGMVVQKQYLLRLLGKFRQTEQETLSVIASMGYPTAPAKPNVRRSLKSVAIAIRFTIKMKASKDQWQNILQTRPAKSPRAA